MSMRILEQECLACGACMMVCPQRAVQERVLPTGQYAYSIDAKLCTDCEDQPVPLCRGECPVPECLVNT